MENLKRLRKERGLTQIGLQIETGIDQALLSKYENGVQIPTTENLIILANFFGTSMDYLMDRTGDPSPPQEPENRQ